MKILKTLDDQSLRKGDKVRLVVNYNKARQTYGFAPAFIDGDLLIGLGARTMRICQYLKNVQLQLNEEWQGRIEAIQLGSPDKKTFDGRRYVFISLCNLQRLEEVDYKFYPEGKGKRIAKSGKRIVSSSNIKYTREEKVYIAGEQIIIFTAYKVGGRVVREVVSATYSVNKYVELLRKRAGRIKILQSPKAFIRQIPQLPDNIVF